MRVKAHIPEACCASAEEALASHWDRVFGVCRRRLSCVADAEDATQEVLHRYLAGVGSIHGDHSRWLVRCARNVCVDHVRSRRRRWHRERRRASAESVTDRGIVVMETRELARQLLIRLNEDERELVQRHIMQGVPQAVLAAERGVSQQMVSRRIREATGKMRRWVGDSAGVLSLGGLTTGFTALTSRTAMALSAWLHRLPPMSTWDTLANKAVPAAGAVGLAVLIPWAEPQHPSPVKSPLDSVAALGYGKRFSDVAWKPSRFTARDTRWLARLPQPSPTPHVLSQKLPAASGVDGPKVSLSMEGAQTAHQRLETAAVHPGARDHQHLENKRTSRSFASESRTTTTVSRVESISAERRSEDLLAPKGARQQNTSRLQPRLMQLLANRLLVSHERTRAIGGHPPGITPGFPRELIAINRLRIEAETDRTLPIPIRLSLLENAPPLSRSTLEAVAIRTDGMSSRIAPVIPIDGLGLQPFQAMAERLTGGDAPGFMALASLVRDTIDFDWGDREIDLQAGLTIGSADLPEVSLHRQAATSILSDLIDLDSTFLTFTKPLDGKSAMLPIARIASALALNQFQASDEPRRAEMLSDVQGLAQITTPPSAFVNLTDLPTWTPVALPEPMGCVGVVLVTVVGMRPRHRKP